MVTTKTFHVAGPFLMFAMAIAACPAGSVITGGYSNSRGTWEFARGEVSENRWIQQATASVIMAPEHVRHDTANDRLVVMRSLPVGSVLVRAGHGLQVGGQLEHLAQARQGLQSGLAQAHAARRAMQQPRTQPPLQPFEMAADHRARQVQRFSGAGQAALVGDLDE